MRKSLITTVNAWPFERPLAIALAASAMFMTMAVPPEHLSVLPSASTPGLHIALALIVGLLLGGAGYAAMAYPWPDRRPAPVRPVVEEALVPEEEQGHFAAAEVSLRLRRADRHPDAPVRKPIFASRDLGSPFMEVGAFAPPPAENDITAGDILEGDFAEVEHHPVVEIAAPAEHEIEHGEPDHAETEQLDHEIVEPEAEPQPVATSEPAWPLPEMPASIAAFAPVDGPAPQPARTQRQSISAMMDRLSAGLERRAAHGGGEAMAQDHAPALRGALEELNRLTARRG